MNEERLFNEIQQMIDDLREIITFNIDDNNIRDDAKRLLKNMGDLLNGYTK